MTKQSACDHTDPWETCMMGEERRPVQQLHVETPLLKSRKLSEQLGCNVWMKLENVQNSGSFKARGIGHLCNKVGRRTPC